MNKNQFKQIITKHLNTLIDGWFSDKPLFKGISQTIVAANLNKFDALLDMLSNENGDILIKELITNLNLKNGYEIDLTNISPLLPKRIIFITKEDVDNLLKDISNVSDVNGTTEG